jgi:hypothetical protein
MFKIWGRPYIEIFLIFFSLFNVCTVMYIEMYTNVLVDWPLNCFQAKGAWPYCQTKKNK